MGSTNAGAKVSRYANVTLQVRQDALHFFTGQLIQMIFSQKLEPVLPLESAKGRTRLALSV